MHRSVDQTTRILRHQPLEGLSLQTSRGIFAGLCSKRTKLRTGVSAMSRQLLIGLISIVMACGLTPTEGHAAPIHDSHGRDVAHLEAKSGLMLSFKDILIENYARNDNFFLGRNCKNIVCVIFGKNEIGFCFDWTIFGRRQHVRWFNPIGYGLDNVALVNWEFRIDHKHSRRVLEVQSRAAAKVFDFKPCCWSFW